MKPKSFIPKNADIKLAAPSTMAASTTCPLPDFCASSEQHPAPTEIANEIQWWNWFASRLADGMQRASKTDIVDVMPGRMRQWPFLSPPGHTPVYDLFIAREAVSGSDA